MQMFAQKRREILDFTPLNLKSYISNNQIGDFSSLAIPLPTTNVQVIDLSSINEVWSKCELHWLTKISATFRQVIAILFTSSKRYTNQDMIWLDWIVDNIIRRGSDFNRATASHQQLYEYLLSNGIISEFFSQEQDDYYYDFASPVIRSLIYNSATPRGSRFFVDCSKMLKGGGAALDGCIEFLEAYLKHLACDEAAQKALKTIRKHNQIQSASDLPTEYQYHFEMFQFARSLPKGNYQVIPEHTVQGTKKRVDLRWTNGNKVGFELSVGLVIFLFLSAVFGDADHLCNHRMKLNSRAISRIYKSVLAFFTIQFTITSTSPQHQPTNGLQCINLVWLSLTPV